MSIHLEVDLPDHMDLDAAELKWRLAAKMYGDGELSLGAAAQLVGVSYEEFMYGVGRFKVSVFQYGVDEIIAESERGH